MTVYLTNSCTLCAIYNSLNFIQFDLMLRVRIRYVNAHHHQRRETEKTTKTTTTSLNLREETNKKKSIHERTENRNKLIRNVMRAYALTDHSTIWPLVKWCWIAVYAQPSKNTSHWLIRQITQQDDENIPTRN